jgi:plastocyanin
MFGAGCSSSDDINGPSKAGGPGLNTPASLAAPGVQVMHVQADDALRFTPATVVVKPGRVRLVFDVKGKMPQTFTSRVLNADSGMVAGGHSATFELIIPHIGRYSFYSAYHKKQGMIGRIVAKP